MPKRGDKDVKANYWCVYFKKPCTPAKVRRCQRELEEKSKKESCSVKVLSSGYGWVQLHWLGDAVKYDAAASWVSRTILLEKELWTVYINSTVRMCRKQFADPRHKQPTQHPTQ